jgi:hypothetical protein
VQEIGSSMGVGDARRALPLVNRVKCDREPISLAGPADPQAVAETLAFVAFALRANAACSA